MIELAIVAIVASTSCAEKSGFIAFTIANAGVCAEFVEAGGRAPATRGK
jgi:hypothetical protein